MRQSYGKIIYFKHSGSIIAFTVLKVIFIILVD